MLNAVRVNQTTNTVTLINLEVNSPDFASLLLTETEAKRGQKVVDIIAVGTAAMQRVQAAIDVEFVDRRFTELTLKFSQSLDALQRKLADEVGKRFSPNEAGSYTKAVGDLVKSAKEELNGKHRELQALLDPDKKSSAVGRLEELLEDATGQFEQMFDPDVKGSYARRLQEQLVSIFGANGNSGTFHSALEAGLQPVLRELRELKEKVEAKKAAEKVIASSSLKGRPFEENVHLRLSQLAQPLGDGVEAVGNGNGGTKAGDFLLAVNGSGKRVVVEARNRKVISLPAIKTELEREMTERAADIAIYVASSQEMLPMHVGDFQVYDDKIVTTMDNLHIGYRVARLLAMSKAPEGAVDVGALRTMLTKVRDSIRSLRDVKSKATQVKKLADAIHADAEGTEQSTLDLIEEAELMLSNSAAA